MFLSPEKNFIDNVLFQDSELGLFSPFKKLSQSRIITWISEISID